MDNGLQIVIALCEEEKIRLQDLVKQCLADDEYLLAHYHTNALYRLNRQLQTLHNIDDSSYDDKRMVLERIASMQQQLEVTDNEYMEEYFSKELIRSKEALERLQQQPLHKTDENAPLLDAVLRKLFQKKVKGVKLILKKKDNLLLAFTYRHKTLKVTLPHTKHLKTYVLHQDNLAGFSKLGFETAPNSLVLKLAGDKEEMLSKLYLILSKIVFELFYFKEFENETYIEYTEISQR